jgi:hypothetical protein
MAQLIEELIESEDERLYWRQAQAAYERLDPREKGELQTEQEIEDGAVTDGILDEHRG